MTPRTASRLLSRTACACLLAFAGIVDATGTGVEAPRDGDGVALGSLARSLVEWVGNATRYDIEPIVAAPPDIVFVSPGDRIELPDETVSIGYEMAGLYSPRVNAVFLVLPWSIRDEHDHGLLLHQLVRAVQHASGPGSCTDRLETEAHALLIRWFAERDVEPMVEPPSAEGRPTCTTSVIAL